MSEVGCIVPAAAAQIAGAVVLRSQCREDLDGEKKSFGAAARPSLRPPASAVAPSFSHCRSTSIAIFRELKAHAA